MKFIYPAIVRQTAPECWEAYLPDLQGCKARGFSLDDCMEEANAAALGWISLELEEEQPFLPPVSDPEDLAGLLREGDLLRNVCVTYRATDGWDE